jgi:hypothetical protein
MRRALVLGPMISGENCSAASRVSDQGNASDGRRDCKKSGVEYRGAADS